MHEYKIICDIGDCFQVTYVKVKGKLSFKTAQSFVSRYAFVWCVELIK